MKKVSVIIATYNGASTIKNVLASIFNQHGLSTDFELEVIVVDDCSTDETKELAQSFEIKFFENKTNSGGPNKGRNKGLEVATGDFICMADQDDIWKPNKLTTLLPYLEKVPIVTSGYRVLDTNSIKTINRVANSEKVFIYYEKNKTFLSKLKREKTGQITYLGSIIFSNQLKHILFEEKYGMVDFDWILRLFHQQNSIEVCEVLYDRLVEDNNLSMNENYRKNDFEYSLASINQYEKDYVEEVRLSKLRINGSIARYYYVIGEMKSARIYFSKSDWSLKTALYYLTTFGGSSIVKKYFNVFG